MALVNPLTLGPDELVMFVLKYEESCGASSTTSGSNKNFPYPERLFGSVESVSSDADLKKIYKRMAIKLHPDKNTHAEASNAFQVLQSCFEATLTIIEAGGSAAGPGKGGQQQQQQQKAPPQQQQKASTKSSKGQAPPQASFTPEQQAYAARQQAYTAKQQAKAAYEEACRKSGAQPSQSSTSSSHQSNPFQGTTHKASTAPQEDYDPEWDDWTEKKEKKSKTTSGYAPPPQASKPSAEDWKDAEAAFASTPTPTASTSQTAANAEDIEYWWDEDSQMYYYLDSKTGEYAWYDEEAEKKKRKAEKKRAKEQAAGGGGEDEYLPGFDLSSDEEGEARLKKIEKHFKKRRRAKMAEVNASRKQRGGYNDDDDPRDPLKMNLDLSDDDIVGVGGDGGVDVDDEELFGDDPEMLALLAEKIELEKKLNRIRRRKKAVEKERVEAEKVLEKAKTKKSAASLASLFQRFGIADEDDEDYEAMYGSAKPKKKDNSYKNILLDDDTPTATTKKAAPTAASSSTSSSSVPKQQHQEQYAAPPSASTNSPVYEPPSSPISMDSSPPDSTSSKPGKMSPAQILAEKRRIAAAAKMNNAGVGSTGGGSYKFQVTCPNCHNYKVTLAKDAADKAIMCTMCNSYFVPSQLIASTAHAVVSGSKASSGGGAKVIRSQLQDRCSCGRARKGGCFMCGD